MEVVKQMARVPTDLHDKPRIPVNIFDCGELDITTGLIKRNQGESLIDRATSSTQVYDSVLQKLMQFNKEEHIQFDEDEA
mmetsp:Transcript_13994/g.23781  ORF Transcript_13994/g.23781 Transcript_13994/m.23781 type:complete len:80 (-) Transcript_13994:778-1017(-)